MIDKQEALDDIDAVLAHRPAHGGTGAVSEMTTVYNACISRWAPPGSSFRHDAASVMQIPQHEIVQNKADAKLVGIVRALRFDIARGKLTDFVKLVHASLFADYLQQAEYLHEENYLQASVVIAGGTLEEHLRQLSQQGGIDLMYLDNRGRTVKKMASRLNDELAKQGVYSRMEHSHVDGWIRLRNEAAHSEPAFPKRAGVEVDAMIKGIRGFMSRFPA